MSPKSLSKKFKESVSHGGLRGTAELSARALTRRVRRVAFFLAYQGFGRQCPVCQFRWRRFIRYPGEPSQLFTREHIIGGGPCDESRCPFCTSTQRERHIFLYLKNCTSVFSDRVRLLHMAPEGSLRRVLERCPNIRYCTADLDSPLASVHTDITRLSFADDTFDVVICNHVLEHIPDDRRAMGELFRVLKPGGWAILQVPIAAARTYTEERPEITNPGERLRLFGQTDHVRLYAAKDYLNRLQAAGFTVEPDSLPKRMGERYSRHFGLLPDEDIYVAKKPLSRFVTGPENTTSRELVLEPSLVQPAHSERPASGLAAYKENL